MKRRLFAPAVLTALFVLCGSPAPLAGFTLVIWSGSNTTGWQGNYTPVFDGSEDFFFGNALNPTVSLTGAPGFKSIHLLSNDRYVVAGQGPTTLAIGTGIFGYAAATSSQLYFDPNISLTGAAGSLTMDAANSSIYIQGHIVDLNVNTPTSVVLTNSVSSSTGFFDFADNTTGNTYTGTTSIGGVAGSLVVISFWNTTPFGSGGTVSITSSAQLIAHNTDTIANPFVLFTATANDPIYLKSWDAPLTFTGSVTLGNNTTLVAQLSQHGFPSADQSGMFPTPGPRARYPIVFTGNIDQLPGAPFSLSLLGPGLFIMEGTSSYTGGTIVNGSLVYGAAGAITAGSVMVNTTGYAGFTSGTVPSFASFLANVNVGSTGAVGVDTLPGNSTFVAAFPLDLTGFNSLLRIGTATSAVLTGTITPQAGSNYQFGNGGGTLYVQSNLGLATGLMVNSNTPQALTVYLQGTNTYTGPTLASNGFLIFDGPNTLSPNTPTLTAGNVSDIGTGYIGYTDAAGVASPSIFLAKFSQANTYGIIGFDATAATLLAISQSAGPPLDIPGAINLSGFNNGVILGTSTGVSFSGVLTPTADNILRLTAALGSTLTVNSTLSGAMAVALGSPTFATDIYSNGTVFLTGNNTYSGGTTLVSTVGGITLEVSNANSLGTGPLTISDGAVAGLQASTATVLANPIVFPTPQPGNFGGSLYLTGGITFELAGAISGPGSLWLLDNNNFVSATLSGDNSGFSGDITLVGATLYLANNNAAGTGTVRIYNNSSVRLDARATSPVLYGIYGTSGTIQLNTGDNLTFDLSNPLNDAEFGGSIGNDGVPAATVTVTSSTSNNTLYLYGNSNYSGGTVVTGTAGAVAAGSNTALGSGPITLNAPQGAVVTNVGVTLTNPLNLTAGSLQGFGTFAPTSVNGVPGGAITFATGVNVAPGTFGLGGQDHIGTLTLATNVDFADGGKFLWSLQDTTTSDGHSTLIANNLNVSATSGGFTIYATTLDANGLVGLASNLTLGTPYTFAIATIPNGGSFTNFDPAAFTIDTSMFQGGATPASNFFLTADTNNLYLNFTAVPEPSTYALLGLGLSAVLLPALRRRRRRVEL